MRAHWPQARPIAPWRRVRTRAEVWIVLGMTLGASAVSAVLSLTAKLLAPGGLSGQSTTLNPQRASTPWLDLAVQLADLGLGLVPVALVLWLLGVRMRPDTGSGLRGGAARLGLGAPPDARTLGRGALLAAMIGVPGLALYAAGRALGVTALVVPSGLDARWWTVPVLLLSALEAALVEETIVSGWLVIRLRELGHGWATVTVLVSLLRGAYHLYQGFGAFLGNAVMGAVFLAAARRWGGVAPLVVAHLLLDTVAFVGWQALGGWLMSTGLLG